MLSLFICAVMIFIVAGIACIAEMPGVAIVFCLVGSWVIVSAVAIYKINKRHKEYIKLLERIADLFERSTAGGDGDGTKE